MNTNILINGILLGAVTIVSAATNDLTTALQRGLFEEEANQNIGAAIQAYQTVANQFDKDRKLAATAIFRLGECYRKQGNTNAAATQYERILREFSDQPTLITLSRQSLAGMGSALPAPGAPTLSDAARQEQKRLLDQEINLVQKQLEEMKKHVPGGFLAGQDAVWATERELLKLKRQLAALDAGLPVSITATETPAPAISTEAEEVKRIQALIKDSPDLINAPDQKGVTLLQSAAAKGKLAVVKVLLESGAAVDGLRQPGLTPLHYAAVHGHKTIVELLLTKGAKPDAQTIYGVAPLHLAALKGYESVAKALLAAGAPVNAQTTRDSSTYFVEDAEYIIGPIRTALHLAAYGGYTGTAELLLSKGADANAEDGNARTPLSLAAERHYRAVVQLLLAAHADPNTATRYALSDAPTLKVLLEAGADPNARASKGAPHPEGTPLLLAAVFDQRQPAVELLLAHQADVNAANPSGWTPLHAAAAYGHKSIAELLLKGGAVVNARNKDGETPLYVAVGRGKRELAELLLANKADPNERNHGGQTPLDVVKNPSTGGLTASMRDTLADLLRKHGASDDLPRLDCIELRRPSIKFSSTVFTKGTNGWNQFTLLDLMGVQYGFLAPSPNAGGGVSYSLSEFVNAAFNKSSSLGFPDLAHVRIRRPAADQKNWQERVVDLRPVLESGDCSKDVRLEWGGVVEIPEADHSVYEQWPGFSWTELANLKKCLTRHVEIVINGQATNFTLAPRISNLEAAMPAPLLPAPRIVAHTPFWLKPVLLQSKLLLTSSDLSQVKVTRRDPTTGQAREWVVDCSEASSAPNLWLRDGDKIEVPEKTN